MIKLEDIKQKKEKLEEIKQALKTEFFGIDDVIDKVIASIESWYIIPQALKSPIIINLWGLTGVGKTQLVRSLVKKLQFTTKFVEVQMDGYSTSSNFGKDSICSILQASDINEGDPGILLLDEFQRYRTIDEQGKGMEVRRYQDVWMLLSDGKFSMDYSLYTEIEREMCNTEYYSERDEDDRDDDQDNDGEDLNDDDNDDDQSPVPAVPAGSAKDRRRRVTKEFKPLRFQVSYYEASSFKRLLRLNESISTIMEWPKTKLDALCREALAKRETNEIDYSKLLIFVCGNLDEAFKIANDLENCDTDADIFYKISRKISIIHIKDSLKERFRPEQISRLGNNHIIYPSLNKNAYQRIIAGAVQRYIDFVKGIGINFIPNDTVYREIYANSVYPTQGARPVFSSIHKIFSSAIPTIALWAFERDLKDVNLSINPIRSQIIAYTPNNTIEVDIDLDIREQKEKNTTDFNTMVAVHEAGHALVHAYTTNLAPMEVNINLASFKGGYMMHDDNFSSKTDLFNDICVGLAGTIAEEVVFGEANRSSGCAEDIESVTTTAASYFRELGYGKIIANVKSKARADNGYSDFTSSDNEIEDLLQRARVRTKEIVVENQVFLGEIVDTLLKTSLITTEQFIVMAKKHNLDVTEQISDVNTNYTDLWKTAQEKIKNKLLA